MKRVLSVNVSRFFKSVFAFSKELLDDLSEKGLICLNGDEILHFDVIEKESYLKGKTVKESLGITQEFASEVLSFIDVPDFDLRE